MLKKKEIIEFIRSEGKVKSQNLVKKYNISRQYATIILRQLIDSGELQKIGSTRNAFYVTEEFIKQNPEEVSNIFQKRFSNKNLEEHKVMAEIENRLPLLTRLKITKENIHSIFYYAFSEIFNNAIEHSQSKHIDVLVVISDNRLFFIINDYGIGVYRNVMTKRKLKSELEAIQDILKGKTTTAPHAHSGEGIFFTSKVADVFVLESFGQQLIVDNTISDIFLVEPERTKKGTKVSFSINLNSNKHLNDVFKKYTGTGSDEHTFNKTEIKIKLYTIGGVHISRSQARRVLSGLDKFKSVILDFDKVPVIGQAFVDEIFRVFKNSNPEIKIKPINMSKSVKFMIDRVD